jgi:hypothetical protein
MGDKSERTGGIAGERSPETAEYLPLHTQSEEQAEQPPEALKLFEVLAADLTGVSGPGLIPTDKIRDLNGLTLPVVRLEKETYHNRPDLVKTTIVVLHPEAIAYAYTELGARESALWWEGYAACARHFEDGRMLHGEVTMSSTAGRLVEQAQSDQAE